MRKTILSLLALVCLSTLCEAQNPSLPKAAEVKRITQDVADWQIDNFDNMPFFRAPRAQGVKTVEGWHYTDRQWQQAAFYAGLYRLNSITFDRKYVNWLEQMGNKHSWEMAEGRLFHADDHAVAQFYLNLAEYFSRSYMYKPTQERFDTIMNHEKVDDWHWDWCDALFMAPPVWARLAKLTKEDKYLEYMDEQFHMTYDKLWDSKERLFYRDLRYLDVMEQNGAHTFWSRGNGWVFGGLALMIPDLPAQWEGREFYINLFKEMATAVKDSQRADGTWSAGMLGDLKAYPSIETSGSSFFTFGVAWGLNNGYLDRETYEPVLLKAWEGITSAVNENGMLGYVQAVGASPGISYSDKSETYGSGAFIAAGAEMYQFLKQFYGEALPSEDASEEMVFMRNGGWCWYQGPRTVINDGKLIIGGVDGMNGDVNVAVYDLESESIDGQVTLHKGLQRDDHNAPALYVRPDGSILSVWAKHAREKRHYYAISDKDNYLKWGDMKIDVPKYKGDLGLTYMNLYYLKDQNKLYNFFRDGEHYNPSFVTSSNHGKSWGNYTHLIANEVSGRNRPYAVYSQKDENTVAIVYTDAHPRDYGNSLYYVEFRNGEFFKADGTKIHSLKNGPLKTTQGEKIYSGSDTKSKPAGFESVPNSAWNCTMVTDENGYPHIGYTLYLSDTDHRYRVAKWDGERWIDREIAYGGMCLYHRESSYTGLMALDPTNPDIVYISSDVNPANGQEVAGTHEIYRTDLSQLPDDKDPLWEVVTFGSRYRNIRPIVVAKDGYKVLLWLHGEWHNFTNYDVNVVGQILERPDSK